MYNASFITLAMISFCALELVQTVMGYHTWTSRDWGGEEKGGEGRRDFMVSSCNI